MPKQSLRQSINDKCSSCIHDEKAAGTRLAQITLCSVHSCPLWNVRPTTDRIPESVLDYYSVPEAERASLGLKNGSEGRFSAQTESRSNRARGEA